MKNASCMFLIAVLTVAVMNVFFMYVELLCGTFLCCMFKLVRALCSNWCVVQYICLVTYYSLQHSDALNELY